MTHSSGPPDRTTLPRALGDFLIEFSLALNRAAMYPSGHPSLERAAEALLGRLSALLAERSTLSLGVAKRNLVVEGVATEDGNPVLRGLAARLHRLHIGAIVFQRGASADEVMDVVRLLATEVERGAPPLGMRDGSVLRSWENIRLYPLAYDQLELVEGEEAGEEREAAKAAQLWVGLARAALAGDADEPPERTSTEPAAVAHAINGHPAAVAYDQVIVGYMLEIAGELRQAGDAAGSAALRRRVTRLVSELSDDVLRRLVDMGGDPAQRRRFLLDAADGFGGSAVVELVRAAAGASQQTVSHSMLRILTKLGTLADAGPGAVRVEAERALREQVRALVGDWQLADPNPAAYTAALEAMATSPARRAGDAPDMAAEPLRVVEMLLELDAESPHAAAAVDGALARGEAGRLLDVLEAADAGPAATALWRLLVDADRLGEWIRSGRADLAALDRLMARAPAAAIAGPLLDALAAEEHRDTRLALLRRAGALGSAVVGEASARLKDDRWFVRRNMVQLLREAGVAPTGGALALAHDEHPLVRREAMLLALALPAERERALALGLRDGDAELVRLTSASARDGVPPAIVPVLAARTADDALEPGLRVELIALLGSTGSPLAAEPLLRLIVRGRTLLRRPRLAPPSAVVIAALRALASLPAPSRRVRDVLDRARRASAPDIRSAVS